MAWRDPSRHDVRSPGDHDGLDRDNDRRRRSEARPELSLDGEDQTGILSGQRYIADRTFFWRTARQGAMRSGKWKYIRDGKTEFLHDLSVDEREQANYAESEPKKLADLRAQFTQLGIKDDVLSKDREIDENTY